MIRFFTDRFMEAFSDAVKLQPQYIEVEDTGAALSLNRVLHKLGRVPRGCRIVNKVVSPGSASGGMTVGTIAWFGVGTGDVPAGWLYCNGAAVSRTTYADLFAEIGTTFGVGDGSTTFNLPDLRGRGPIGTGTGSGLTARTLAATGGAETHQLTVDELASHRHEILLNVQEAGTGTIEDSYGGVDSGYTEYTGGDQAHNNMQPFLVLTPCIASSGGGGSSAYVPLDWHRLSTDAEWTARELTLRFNLANARVLLEVF